MSTSTACKRGRFAPMGSGDGQLDFAIAGCGMGCEATMHTQACWTGLTEAWRWNAPFSCAAKPLAEAGNQALVWEGHTADGMAAAAAAQTEVLAGVHGTVAQWGGTTQKHSALAENLSATAASLQVRAEDFQAIVAGFHFGRDASVQSLGEVVTAGAFS